MFGTLLRAVKWLVHPSLTLGVNQIKRWLVAHPTSCTLLTKVLSHNMAASERLKKCQWSLPAPPSAEVDKHFNPDPFHVSVLEPLANVSRISEGPRASECGDLSLFGLRPASLQRRGQPCECVSSLSLTRVWLALRHRTCAVSHTEPCAQDSPMLALMWSASWNS